MENMKAPNKMQEIRIEKVVLSIGGTAEDLEKGYKLLSRMTGRKPSRRCSKKRIPSLDVRPGLEVGCLVTLRGKEAEEMLKRLLESIDNQLKAKQFSENSFSFGIKEYIEIPGMEYQRDIGIIGFDATVAFTRPGKRIARKKIKMGKLPKRHHISPSEIIKFMEDKFNIKLKEK
jgi:large subunit ribosomal protein L5